MLQEVNNRNQLFETYISNTNYMKYYALFSYTNACIDDEHSANIILPKHHKHLNILFDVMSKYLI